MFIATAAATATTTATAGRCNRSGSTNARVSIVACL